ncbi:MAG TPA: ATP-binding protein, partial [Chloroflexia bacterium]|nr:ATP-binding protein [Chloroflexia bacterium]
ARLTTRQDRDNNRLAPLLIGVVIVLVFVLAGIGVVTELVGQGVQRDIQDTNDLLLAERTLYGLHVDMQAANRGYIITEDERFLEPYRRAEEQLPALWETLAREGAALDARNEREPQPVTARLNEMQAASTTWYEEFGQVTVDLVRAGRTQEAIDMVRSGRGNDLFNDFRERNTRLNDLLTERLSEYTGDLTRIRRNELYLLIGVGVLALVSAILAAAVSRRENALQRKATQAAEAGTARLRAIIESLPVPVRLLAPPNGNIVLQNHAAEHLFPTDEWNNLRLEERADHYRFTRRDGTPFSHEEFPSVRALIHGEPTRELEMLVELPGLGARSLLVSAVPLRDEQGTINAAAVVLQDVTHMRELDARKDEFIATAAHELRNPLSALYGYIQLQNRQASSADVPPAFARYLEEMTKLSRRLNVLVELLLDASRISLGRLVLDKGETNLADVARSVVSAAETTDQGEHRLELVAPDGIIGKVDATRIEQVLTNLLGNALRYSPPGTLVLVRVEQRDGQALVEVADNGPGVPDEMRPHLFNRYYQDHKPNGHNAHPNGGTTKTARRERGLGLGLHISKEIVSAHGGEIGMRPNPRGGSIFWFTLPLGSDE